MIKNDSINLATEPDSTKSRRNTVIKSAQWKEIKTDQNIYSARTGHCVVGFGNSFYMFGGVDGTELKNDIFSFTYQEETLKLIKNNKSLGPEPCSGMQAISLKSYI